MIFKWMNESEINVGATIEIRHPEQTFLWKY